jgi:ferrochelatase
LAESVKEFWQKEGKADKLLMSFHGLPRAFTQKGDPYQAHCETTAKLLAKALGLAEHEWMMSYQSRLGLQAWLSPYTDQVLKTLPNQGVKNVQVICPAFVSDCLETLEEIEIQNQEVFIQAGGEKFAYISALNDRTDFIDFLKTTVLRHTEVWIGTK